MPTGGTACRTLAIAIELCRCEMNTWLEVLKC